MPVSSCPEKSPVERLQGTPPSKAALRCVRNAAAAIEDDADIERAIELLNHAASYLRNRSRSDLTARDKARLTALDAILFQLGRTLTGRRSN